MSRALQAGTTSFSPSLTAEEISRLVARATFLWERADAAAHAAAHAAAATATTITTAAGTAAAAANDVVDARLQRWAEVVGRGDVHVLQKRLAWDGLDIGAIRGRLVTLERLTPSGTQAAPDLAELPDWAPTVAEIIDAEALVPLARLDAHRAAPALPFEHLLYPALLVARRRVHAKARPGASTPNPLLTSDAYFALERALIKRLSQISAPTLELAFADSRPLGSALLNLVDGDDASDADYRDFVACGLRDLFQTYPVLARLIATAVVFWEEFVTEFCGRLAGDIDDIARVFVGGPSGSVAPLGPVVHIAASMSDAHQRGKTVLVARFASGLRIVYKPKDITLEADFNALIDWCNHASGMPAFKRLTVIPRDHYGWVEYVEHLPCKDEQEAKAFFANSGRLLALLYALRATDCHYENIVAHGAYPVLVDMETLLHHEPNLIDDSPLALEIQARAVQTFWDSVLRTGMLPRWEMNDSGQTFDISGLGRPDARPRTVDLLAWAHVNTDAMHRAQQSITLPLDKNAAHIGDRVLSASDYRSEIVEGFRQMYGVLLVGRSELIDGPLRKLGERSVRFIFRPTRTYGAMLEAVLAPDHLEDGADFSIELDHLSRAFLVASSRPAAFDILRAEARALSRLDVPLLMARADCAELQLDDGAVIEGYFKDASFTDTLRHLERFSEADLACQCAIIEGAFDAKIATVESRHGGAWNAAPLPVPAREEFIAAARRIADDLARRAIPEPDGSINWIGLDFLAQAERFQLQVLNNTLCDGRGGVALFLAALAKVTGEVQYRDLAMRAVYPLRRQIRALDVSTREQIARFIGTGAATGLPSMIYCLTRIGTLLDDPALLHDATALLSWLTPELIASDQHLDVMSGSAGGILALAALRESTGDALALTLAQACGEHLLQRQEASGGWKTFWEQPLTGYSHGAAGSAYALARLHALTGDTQFADGAMSAIRYEASVFNSTEINWPDYRRAPGPEGPGYVKRWCHGAPGIALARIGTARYLRDVQIETDIGHGLLTTERTELNAIDHLCCGNFGRIEVMWVASAALDRDDLRRIALLNAANVMARAERNHGAYQLFPNLPTSVFNPGFLPGSSGIGYQLLRLAEPTLPSVLLWD